MPVDDKNGVGIITGRHKRGGGLVPLCGKNTVEGGAFGDLKVLTERVPAKELPDTFSPRPFCFLQKKIMYVRGMLNFVVVWRASNFVLIKIRFSVRGVELLVRET